MAQAKEQRLEAIRQQPRLQLPPQESRQQAAAPEPADVCTQAAQQAARSDTQHEPRLATRPAATVALQLQVRPSGGSSSHRQHRQPRKQRQNHAAARSHSGHQAPLPPQLAQLAKSGAAASKLLQLEPERQQDPPQAATGDDRADAAATLPDSQRAIAAVHEAIALQQRERTAGLRQRMANALTPARSSRLPVESVPETVAPLAAPGARAGSAGAEPLVPSGRLGLDLTARAPGSPRPERMHSSELRTPVRQKQQQQHQRQQQAHAQAEQRPAGGKQAPGGGWREHKRARAAASAAQPFRTPLGGRRSAASNSSDDFLDDIIVLTTTKKRSPPQAQRPAVVYPALSFQAAAREADCFHDGPQTAAARKQPEPPAHEQGGGLVPQHTAIGDVGGQARQASSKPPLKATPWRRRKSSLDPPAVQQVQQQQQQQQQQHHHRPAELAADMKQPETPTWRPTAGSPAAARPDAATTQPAAAGADERFQDSIPATPPGPEDSSSRRATAQQDSPAATVPPSPAGVVGYQTPERRRSSMPAALAPPLAAQPDSVGGGRARSSGRLASAAVLTDDETQPAISGALDEPDLDLPAAAAESGLEGASQAAGADAMHGDAPQVLAPDAAPPASPPQPRAVSAALLQTHQHASGGSGNSESASEGHNPACTMSQQDT